MKLGIYSIVIVVLLCVGIRMNVKATQIQDAVEPKRADPTPVAFQLAKPDKPLILLKTMVNDEGPFVFVLDTGAGGTIVSPALAKKLDLKPDDNAKPAKATGAGGQIEIQFAEVNSIQVGSTRVAAIQVGIMDLGVVSNAIETELDGIIGYNFLKKFRLVIDYPKQTVSFE
jgi:predicted aspartyl protease